MTADSADSTASLPRGAAVRRFASTVHAAWKIVLEAARRALLVTIAMQLLGAVSLFGVLLMGKVLLDRFTGPDPVSGLAGVALPLVGLAAFSLLGAVAGAYVAEQRRLLMELVERHLESKIVKVVVGVELQDLDDAAFHDRLQRALAAFVDRPYDLVNGVVSGVGALAGIVAIGAVLFPIVPWLLPVLLVAAVPLARVGSRNSRALYAGYRDMTALDRRRIYLKDVLTSARAAAEVRLFDAQRYLLPQYEVLYDERMRTVRRLSRDRARRTAGVQGGVALLGVGVVGLLVQLTVTGRLSVAEAGVAAIGVQRLMQQLSLANGSATSMHESSLFMGDLTTFLGTPPRHDQALTAEPAERRWARLTVDRVSFTYPGTRRLVLEDVSLHVERGEVVALVGPNGAGKSTLVKLLCGLYQPSAGSIGDHGQGGPASTAEHRDNVTAVFQDFARYSLTVRDNIALGDYRRVSDGAALEEAATRAGVAQVIHGLPDGYDTVLSRTFERGADLSVGQWQRIALARALFREAPFILLDEPTAAADAGSEAAFLERLRRDCHDRGVLLITHRISTARRADRIYVLDDGRVVESGTPAELSATGGPYATLVKLSAERAPSVG